MKNVINIVYTAVYYSFFLGNFMNQHYQIILMTPTYNRPNDVKNFVGSFGKNLVKYKHTNVPIFIIDDSVGDIAKKNIENIKKSKPKDIHVYYAGEKEKDQVKDYLQKKLKITNRNLNRILKSPCYGGNRNWSVLYTFGEKYISCDDDMWPYGVFLKKRTPLKNKEIWNGAFVRRKQMKLDAEEIEFDQIRTYTEFLGKKAKDFPNLIQGDVLFGVEEDTAKSLHASIQGKIKLNTTKIVPKTLSKDANIKFVIIHTSGDGDIDSEDIIINFIEEGTEELLKGKEEYKYVFSNFSTCLTKQSWRITPAILGVDNRKGIIPYAPTYYRFEDFVYRIYAAYHPDVVTAYANGMQHHERSLDARASIVNDFLNEETAKLMKQFLMNNVLEVKDLQLKFPEYIEITLDQVKNLVEKGKKYFDQAKKKQQINDNYKNFTMEMAATLDYFRDPRRLYNVIQRSVQQEIDDINYANSVWPDIFEAIIAYKKRKSLPMQSF